MRTSIRLQEPFSYSGILLLICLGALVLLTYYLLRLKKKKETIKTVENKVKVIPEKNLKNIPVIKNKYLKQLEFIECQYTNKKIDLRKAYQGISEAIRLFVFEMTDITTQNYSLAEIKKINLPILYELIEEYYEPEFASQSVGDFSDAINKARRVINKWN